MISSAAAAGHIKCRRVSFIYQVQMRFSDADAMGHVNHARYLTYLEDARVALLAHMAGDSPRLQVADVILARIEMDYLRPLQPSLEPVTVTITVGEIRNKSYTLDYTIEHEGELAARASSVVVAYDYEAQSSRPLTDVERQRLQEITGTGS